jgi:hypothetical protein
VFVCTVCPFLSRSVPENLCLQPEKRTVNCLAAGRFQRKPSRVCFCCLSVSVSVLLWLGRDLLLKSWPGSSPVSPFFFLSPCGLHVEFVGLWRLCLTVRALLIPSCPLVSFLKFLGTYQPQRNGLWNKQQANQGRSQ